MAFEKWENKHYWALILLISIIFFFSRIYEPSLSGDAAKYALIAKTMLKTGNFLIPQLGDEFYFKKPPFFFWLIALCFKIFGISEFSARLPSALFATIDAILIYIIGRNFSGSKTAGFLAAIVFIVNFEIIRISTIVRFESYILLINLLSLLLLTNPTVKKSLLAGTLIGTGLLTKGPLALFGVISTMLQAITEKNSSKIKLQFLTLLIALSIFGPYLAYMYKYHPAFFKEFFKNQIIGRLEGSLKEGTPRSFFFYERIILKHFWIWNFFLLVFIFQSIKTKGQFIKETLIIKDKPLWTSFLFMFLLIFIPLHFVSLKFTRYSYYFYPFLAVIVSFTILKLKWERNILYFAAFTTITYAIVALVCPCKFHKDKLKTIKPLIEVGINNFHHLKIDKTIDKYTAYALMFYYDNLSRSKNYEYSLMHKNCRKSVIKYGNYCIVRNKGK